MPMDTPQEIYARPATLFVATFIGTMNRLDAHLDGPGWLRAGPFAARMPDTGGGPSGGQRPTGGLRSNKMQLKNRWSY